MEECFRLGSVTDAGYIFWTSEETPSGESRYTRNPCACLDVLCVVRRVDWKREAEGSIRGRGVFSKGRQSRRGLGEVGVGSAGSVLKVKRRSKGDPLCSQIKELEEEGLLFAQSEESQ